MKSVCIILGDQLFASNKTIDADIFVMIESLVEAKRFKYHQFKLAYLFTTMREHADYLRKEGKTVLYYTLEDQTNFETVLNDLSKTYSTLLYLPPNDQWFGSLMNQWSKRFEQIKLAVEHNQSFLTDHKEFKTWLDLNGARKLKMANFYIWQRKRLGLLVDENGKPTGDSWSFDDQNRQKLPKTQTLPVRTWSYESEHYDNVCVSIKKLLPHHPGTLGQTSWIPTTNKEAEQHLKDFIAHSLEKFGPYEDALSTRDSYLFHSALSPLINNGLLTPHQVITSVMEAYNSDKVTHLPSIEGFVRQVIGWREWVKGLYDHVYTKPYTQYNALKHTVDLPEYFYDHKLASSEVRSNTPLMDTLTTVHNLAWSHHIPRLMILANWMTLNRYDPVQCYEWFLSQFVDGSEWVMVANVFGMGLFADGGIYATKPYIAGGNYLKKMSDYPDSKQWEKTWTDLYWEFLKDNRMLFMSNPRMAMIIKHKFG